MYVDAAFAREARHGQSGFSRFKFSGGPQSVDGFSPRGGVKVYVIEVIFIYVYLYVSGRSLAVCMYVCMYVCRIATCARMSAILGFLS